MRPDLKLLGALFLAACLTACGGGSGASAPASRTVTLKVSTVAKAGDNPQIKGVTLVLLLPAGVSVRTAGSSRQTADGVVRYSGDSAFSNVTSQLVPRPLFGSYSAAGATGRGALAISFLGPTPFGAGEFATVTCELAAGASATASAFQVLSFQAVGDSATHLADDLTARFDPPTITLGTP